MLILIAIYIIFLALLIVPILFYITWPFVLIQGMEEWPVPMADDSGQEWTHQDFENS